MPNLTSDSQTFSSQIFSSSATQQHPLGARAVDRYGRVFRYVLAGGNLVVGNILQASAQNTAHQQLTPSANNIGDLKIVATLGASAAAANLYADGFAIIDTTPSLGLSYPISGHSAVDASGVITALLPSDSPAQIALTSSSRVSLQRNKYAGVIQAPATTLTGAVVGVAVFAITSGQYGWIQTAGVCAVLITGTPAVGSVVVSPSGTAGAAATDPADAAVTIIGSMMVTGVSGKVQAVNLRLD